MPQTPPDTRPDLASYDVILVNISGGKDSQASLDETVRAADAAGVRDRLVTVFCDLGEDDEWPGTLELAAEHATFYGIRHEVVCRIVDGEQQSLSEHIEARGKWPGAATRYCTSDMKRGPVFTLLTRLAAERRAAGHEGRVRILNVMGLRAQESPKRALMKDFRNDPRASNKTVRLVDEWLPIHAWTVEQVWARIAECGTRPHPIYGEGMPRLSCRFCVLASTSALVRAAQLDPAGAQKRVGMEQRMGHTFKNGQSMSDIVALAATATAAEVQVEDWAA